jgi:hypothetical protein
MANYDFTSEVEKHGPIIKRYFEYADGRYHAEFFGKEGDEQWDDNEFEDMYLSFL